MQLCHEPEALLIRIVCLRPNGAKKWMGERSYSQWNKKKTWEATMVAREKENSLADIIVYVKNTILKYINELIEMIAR